MRHILINLMVLSYSAISLALVDMRNANYSETWTDLDTGSGGFELKIERTYNSRSLHNGIFGFGWCSNFETKLSITSIDTIIVKECGSGMRTEYSMSSSKKTPKELVVKIMAEVRNRNKGQPESFFTNIQKQLGTDIELREEFAKQLGLSGELKKGAKYLANGRANEWITHNGSEYIRRLANGTQQKFSNEGHLIEIRDKSSNFLRLSYSGDKLVKMADNKGTSLQFKYKANSKYVNQIQGPNNLKATYSHTGESLVTATNAWGNTYTYKYDELQNLVKTTYPDKTFISISYDKDKDWVMGFRDRQGCQETYKYTEDKKNPLNNYGSEVQKVCDGKVTNKSKYSFQHKSRKDGSRFLHKSEAEINGQKSSTLYHPTHGKPMQIVRDGYTTDYEYYETGLLKLRKSKDLQVQFAYKNNCQKPSAVRSIYFLATGQGRTPSKVNRKVITTKFQYDAKTCLLDSAKNSDGQFAKVQYDRLGRIRQIEDQSKKIVNIQYDDRFGKPAVVERPGLGTIRFKYKKNGDLEKIESGNDATVASQVAAMFSNLLEIIGPGTTDTLI